MMPHFAARPARRTGPLGFLLAAVTLILLGAPAALALPPAPLAGWEMKIDQAPDDPASLAGFEDGGWTPWTGAAPLGVRAVWLRTALPQGGWRDASVYLFRVRHKFVAYVDGEPVFRYGDPTSREEREYLGEPSALIPLPKDAAGRTLMLRVHSAGDRLGPDGEMLIGDRADLLERMVRKDLVPFTLGVIPLFLGLTALGLFAILLRIRMLASFGLFCVCFGVYAVCHTKIVYQLATAPLTWDHLQYFATYLIPFFFVDFTGRVLDGFHFRRILSVAKTLFPVQAVAALVLSASRLAELDQTLPLFQASVIVCGLALIVEFAVRMWQGSVPAQLFCIGAITVCAAAIHDILVERGLLPWRAELLYGVILAFIGALALILARKLRSDARKQVLLQQELETAGILQTRFLPSRFLGDEKFTLSAFNRAALHVGGDWYAYRVFHDRWLQIHIGDVTGHGTRAALLAAFAKGAVDFYYEDCERQCLDAQPPLDTLHTLLNHALFEMGKNEATMTLASISVDLCTGEVEYVNSGHLPPLVRTAGAARLKRLTGRNDTMLGLDKDFRSRPPSRIRLSGEEMLLVHSDGLYEVFAEQGDRTGVRQAADFMMKQFAGDEAFAEQARPFAPLEATASELEDDVTLIAVKLNLRLPRRAAA